MTCLVLVCESSIDDHLVCQVSWSVKRDDGSNLALGTMVAVAATQWMFLLPLMVFAFSPVHALFVSTPATVARHDCFLSTSTTVSSKLLNDNEENDARKNSFLTPFSPSSSATRRLALQQILLTTTVGTLGASMAMTIPKPAAAVTAQAVTAAAAPASSRSTYWPLGKVAFSLLPLAGTYTRRATIIETVCTEKGDGSRGDMEMTTVTGMASGRVWTLDQIQGVVNVNVPVRMVVIKVSVNIYVTTNKQKCSWNQSFST